MIPTRTLHCTDPHCRLPAGHIVNGSLVFITRHGGKKHECVISLEHLRQLLAENVLTKRETNVLDSAVTASPSI